MERTNRLLIWILIILYGGGIIGDDGVENIEIGQEISLAQTYSEFQEYIKLHKRIGVLLTVNSKNDKENAIGGFERPDSILHQDDFVSLFYMED